MSIKEELHHLVEQLGDDRATEVLVYVRHLLIEEEHPRGADPIWRAWPEGPRMIAGRAFFSPESPDIATLAAEQGVGPITDFDALLGDFSPEDESADDFTAAVRQWRREGGDV